MSHSAASIAIAVTVERHHLIRERTFDRHALTHPLSELLDLLGLHDERATGKLVLNLSGGTCGSIQFEERAQWSPDDSQ